MNLLALYEKLEHLVQSLPGPLQSPILREITPIRTLFLQRRPPRVVLLGNRAASRTALINALFGAVVAESAEDHVQAGAWQLFTQGHGDLRLLDARRPYALPLLRRALTTEPPDIFLFLHADGGSAEDTAADLEQAREVVEILRINQPGAAIPVLGVAVKTHYEGDAQAARQSLHEALCNPSQHPFGDKVGGFFVLDPSAGEAPLLAKAIALELPPEARLEMGRLSGVREVQRESAQVIIKSMSAIAGAVGAQPIPLADLPVLTSLQAALVAGIMHISGREMNLKLAGEWVAALGANIGLALALREGARAALKFVPVWGDVISGGIAAAGTYAIGRSAAAYFIEGFTIQDARKLFKAAKKESPLLKDEPRDPL